MTAPSSAREQHQLAVHPGQVGLCRARAEEQGLVTWRLVWPAWKQNRCRENRFPHLLACRGSERPDRGTKGPGAAIMPVSWPLAG